MSGWVITYSLNGTEPNQSRLAATRQLIRTAGESCEEVSRPDGTLMLATWRRSSAEFPDSGRIHQTQGGVRVAWLGQCLEDDGNASQIAMQKLSEIVRSSSMDFLPLSRLNGPFSAVAFHETAGPLIIAVDRHRHLPVYLYEAAEVLIATTDVRMLGPWIGQPRLCRTAVNLFLSCGELIDDLTLLEGVRVLPSASTLAIHGNNVKESRFWSFRHEPDASYRRTEVAAQLGERLRNAVRRVERASESVGITLSGGLDSRFLLGVCSDPRRIRSFTWGLPQCRDITCARDFAQRTGSPHEVHEWNSTAFPPLWPRGVAATGGAFGVDSMYMLPFAEMLGSRCSVILNGLAGDVLLGGNFIKNQWLRERSPRALAEKSWRWRVSERDEQNAERLFPGEARESRDRWVDSILREQRERPILRLMDWLFENREFRWTNCGTMLLRQHVESHAPFFDRDFLDLALQVPLEWKSKHRLYLRTLAIACPVAGQSPWQRTGIPPAWGFTANLFAMASHRIWTRLMKTFGRTAFPRLAVAAPAEWMRTTWRNPIQSILLSERMLDRGLFDADAVRALWDLHLKGVDSTRTIGAMLAVELFARTMDELSAGK